MQRQVSPTLNDPVTPQTYRGEDDFWRVRAFLRDVFLLNDRQERSWQVARLDYWRWHVRANCQEIDTLDGAVTIWETAGGEIAAVLNPEDPGHVFLQVHPAARSSELEAEMLDAAESRLGAPGPDGSPRVVVWAHEDDPLRQSLLAERGYTQREGAECQHQRVLDGPLPAPSPAPGYTLRALGDADELLARSWVSWRALHPDEPDAAYEGWEWYRSVQRLPLYRRDLDIVAAAADGELAGFCTLWYDDAMRTGYFEPVGVAPEHQRRGLGRAMMLEAMRRAQAMGATLVTVAGFSEAANSLYASVMGGTTLSLRPWVKPLGG